MLSLHRPHCTNVFSDKHDIEHATRETWQSPCYHSIVPIGTNVVSDKHDIDHATRETWQSPCYHSIAPIKSDESDHLEVRSPPKDGTQTVYCLAASPTNCTDGC